MQLGRRVICSEVLKLNKSKNTYYKVYEFNKLDKIKPIPRSEAANLHPKRHCVCCLYWRGENVLQRGRVIDTNQTTSPNDVCIGHTEE